MKIMSISSLRIPSVSHCNGPQLSPEHTSPPWSPLKHRQFPWVWPINLNTCRWEDVLHGPHYHSEITLPSFSLRPSRFEFCAKRLDCPPPGLLQSSRLLSFIPWSCYSWIIAPLWYVTTHINIGDWNGYVVILLMPWLWFPDKSCFLSGVIYSLL